MDYYLLIGGLGAILLGYAISFDYRNPYLCKTLKVYTICKKDSFLHKLFPHKEDRLHPHSLLLIMPLFISLIVFPFILTIYILYWVGNIDTVNNFMNSKIAFIIGGSILVLYFIYPLILILTNEIFKIREKLMDEVKFDSLNDKYEKYYSQFDKEE